MKNKLVMPSLPSSYWVSVGQYRCKECGKEYNCALPHGNDLVKFVEDNGKEERWLPTFESGGYLDLLEKTVPGYKKDQQITMAISKIFESSFKILQEPSSSGNRFSIAVGCFCPICRSKSVEILHEDIQENIQLEWMRYKDTNFVP